MAVPLFRCLLGIHLFVLPCQSVPYDSLPSTDDGGRELAAIVSNSGAIVPGATHSLKREDAIIRSLIRSVRYRHLLSNFGEIFAHYNVFLAAAAIGSEGVQLSTFEKAQRMYDLSSPVSALSKFISHSWSDSRVLKLLAVCDVHHRRGAIGVAMLYWLGASVVTFFLRMHFAPSIFPLPWLLSFSMFVLVPMLVTFAVYLFGHFVLDWCVASTCFLDKLCIHQEDVDLKLAGVNSLGATLQCSERLTILWSDAYLTRLWCIFEVATFSRYHDASAVELQPLWLSPFLLVGMVCNVLVLVFAYMLMGSAFLFQLIAYWGPSRGVGMCFVIVNLLPSSILCYALRTRALKQELLKTALSKFELGNAKCTVESDRPLVCEEVKKLYGSEAQFQEYVRVDLLQAVSKRLGSSIVMPYEWAVFICLPFVWYMSADIFAISTEAAAAIGYPDWSTYWHGSIEFYMLMAALVFPLVYTSTNASASATQNLPFALGWCLDMLTYHVMTFVLCTLLAWQGSLLFTGYNDNIVAALSPS